MDITKVLKVGNGFYINISVAYMSRLNLAKGSNVTVQLTEKGLLIKPLKISEEGKDEKGTSTIDMG